ncbi:hypothetical protein AB0J01_42835 [Streptomyces sp. NPDC050204]|uniref:hypothetical protein n=1 Tax=unclassified Streptomyces TaxID=2593676 RepID=UPI002DDC5BDD|nr:hypothetical protein [Streptomyces sp. NBC_01768]WSC25437.1 hypothetical protein OG902_01230 [Streptomyces sp. NBC_01768]
MVAEWRTARDQAVDDLNRLETTDPDETVQIALHLRGPAQGAAGDLNQPAGTGSRPGTGRCSTGRSCQ